MTTEKPSAEKERSSSTPETELTASSSFSVTSVSISWGAAPGSRLVIVTKGMSTFGKRSRPRVVYPKAPTTTRVRMRTVAKTGRSIQISASFCMKAHLPVCTRTRAKKPGRSFRSRFSNRASARKVRVAGSMAPPATEMTPGNFTPGYASTSASTP